MKKDNNKKTGIRIYSTGIIALLAISPYIISSVNHKETGKEISIATVLDEDVNYIHNEEIEKLVEELYKTKNKTDILNKYTKCDTLEKIFERQEQLESLSLTDEDKIYKDCPLSAELQRFIYEQSTLNNIPFDFLLSIIHVETRGNFNSSGQIGYNSTSHDLGLTQQNTISSLPNFMKIYNVNYDDGYQLLKDNDYANICAAMLICNEISTQFSEYDPYEFAGCYNGWLNWKNYNSSREYVSMFQQVYDEIYTDYHNVKQTKINNTDCQKKKQK